MAARRWELSALVATNSAARTTERPNQTISRRNDRRTHGTTPDHEATFNNMPTGRAGQTLCVNICDDAQPAPGMFAGSLLVKDSCRTCQWENRGRESEATLQDLILPPLKASGISSL